MRQMGKTLFRTCVIFCFALLLIPSCLMAAQQYEGLCAAIKMEILQDLTIERIGFLATLKITNNEVDASITDFSARLTFYDPEQSEPGNPYDASGLFFVQPPEVEGITAIDGTGIIRPGETATISWFIIPKVAAGGTTPDGRQYHVGAELGGSIYAQRIAPEILKVIPDVIWVLPEPQLEITYFQPRDVDGDDPSTPDIVEAPIPFTLGVLVKNTGYGWATNVRIESRQPRIVSNEQSLLIIPQLLGARIDDEPTEPSLTLYLGNIAPGKCRKGAWDMMTTMSGEFIEFNATYTHASDLGGRDTSVISDMNAYFIVHEVKNDQPGRDDLLDFLADTVDDEEMLPDTLFESDCFTSPVNRLDTVERLDYNDLTARIRAVADKENWAFIRLDDPAQAKYDIDRVVRSDGKILNPNNYWTNIRYRKSDNAKLTFLNIFDFVSLGTYEYTVTYKEPGSDTEPPVTFLRFSGAVQEQDGKYYVLPETRMFFTVEDAGPANTLRKLDTEADFIPALPFSISVPGEHTLLYYSVDAAGNAEVQKTADIIVSDTYPEITNLVSDTDRIFIAGDTVSVRPGAVRVSFDATSSSPGLNAEADVYQGVYAFPTVSGVPSSPTPVTDATITVGGENVDYYKYRLNDGLWSDEFSVSTAISLTGLNGTVHLSVKGRNQYGEYHSDEEAVTVSWLVDAGAPAIAITGMPETPSRDFSATFSVSGTNYYCYRVDSGAYRPDTGPGAAITLTHLMDGLHSVEVLSRADAGEACPADDMGTIVHWTIDHSYGLEFPPESRVRHENIGQLGGGPAAFVWDGKDDSGAAVPPGWYTIKLTVHDGLGRSGSAVRLVRMGGMLADAKSLSQVLNAGQKEAHAFGRWVVWQDQRSGNWDIYAMDLSDEAATPTVVRENNLNQERPRTDGTYVVWEDRQADGTWDIWAKKLNGTDPAFAVTQTPDAEERKPAVYWPWVIYETRPVTDPSAPWQLKAYNARTDTFEMIDPTTQDQLDPCIYRQRVVWQDFRDAGSGEIYLKDLKTGIVRRITTHPGGQYYPAIYGPWIVWADNRNSQFDLYGYHLLRGTEIQLTNTPEDETRPRINGDWVVYSEDSSGEMNTDLRMLSLSNLATVQLTKDGSQKEKPSLASGKLVWTDIVSGVRQTMIGKLPDLHLVFNNENMVPVTEGMVSNLQDAYSLLALWHREAGVTAVTRYTSLVPTVESDTATWQNGQPAGNNFTLTAGTFLCARFDQGRILDLGQGTCPSLDLSAGVNVFGYPCFPDQYSAYNLVREIGSDNIAAVRVLDSNTGRWRVVSVLNDRITGENFIIPRIAVLMIDMKTSIHSWKPGE